jgi:hypothetical protein
MKKLLALLTLVFMAANPLASFGQAGIETDPAYLNVDKVLDLKAIPPQVNVNLPRFLLKDALSGLTNSPDNPLAKAGIDLPDLLKDVKLIRVVVIEATTNNRPALDKSMKELRAELDGKWTPIVTVPESNVGIYALGDPSGESMAGIALLVYDNGEAVIANVVGHVSIGKVIKIAMQTGKLPKDLLKQLQSFGDQKDQQTDAKGTGDASTSATAPADTAKKD